MKATQGCSDISEFVGVGTYTPTEAARLLRTSTRNIKRWLSGYTYKRGNHVHEVEPLWAPQHRLTEDRLELGFRDLIELRFVKAFLEAGVGLLAIRNCLSYARECVNDDRPFSTRRFQTDGKTIFLESIERSGEGKLLDLKRRQYAFKQIVERTFKDLDIEDDAVARWRPFDGKPSIIIDPNRAFGQPIAADYGVPTIALAEAVEAEGSPDYVARIFEVPIDVVRDAVAFERELKSAA
jgi:uncharacterized protein (DUF433 family)